MDLGQWIVIGLSILMGAWFGVGSYYNRKRGIATYHWIQGGLKRLGKISEAAWIGSASSGARLVVGNAEAPFRRIEVVFLLESREILPLWLLNRVRNKQDEMILKAGLRSAPTDQMELSRGEDHQIRAMIARSGAQSFEQLPAQKGFLLAHRGGKNSELVGRLTAFLERYSDAILRISVQRQKPNLMIRVDLPALREGSAEEFFDALHEMFK
ncbi:MAG TPA: hypothetical protein VE136_00915 [Anaerolineales bacterium]|jgi:hypothetical protein|nr:hypothetical protein [Anaerolineales bacterium]